MPAAVVLPDGARPETEAEARTRETFSRLAWGAVYCETAFACLKVAARLGRVEDDLRMINLLDFGVFSLSALRSAGFLVLFWVRWHQPQPAGAATTGLFAPRLYRALARAYEGILWFVFEISLWGFLAFFLQYAASLTLASSSWRFFIDRLKLLDTLALLLPVAWLDITDAVGLNRVYLDTVTVDNVRVVLYNVAMYAIYILDPPGRRELPFHGGNKKEMEALFRSRRLSSIVYLVSFHLRLVMFYRFKARNPDRLWADQGRTVRWLRRTLASPLVFSGGDAAWGEGEELGAMLLDCGAGDRGDGGSADEAPPVRDECG